MVVLNAVQIRSSEEKAVLSGAFSFRELMYKAGISFCKILERKYEIKNKKIAVICGNGNNGGDGFVIARYLYEHGADVKVFLPLGNPRTEDASYYFEKLPNIVSNEEFDGCFEMIIDAVFGIGLTRAPDTMLENLFEKMNNNGAKIISVDIPSGVESDTGKVFNTAVRAELTITFIAYKPCFMLPVGSDYCGETVVCDIGVKPIDFLFETIKKPSFPKRLRNSHKGTYGTSLIIAGSYGMAGALMLCSKAALRSGVGIAKCVICKSIYPAFTSYLPEAVCIPTAETENGTLDCKFIDIKSLTKGCSALLFGPGIKTDESTLKILRDILKNSNIPTVIDADGINLIAKNIELLKESKVPLVLTPHPAEMARLCCVSVDEVENNRINIAKEFAVKYNCHLVLKGANTIVATPNGEISVNMCGNPSMAKGGSGDVLAGVIVSLLAQRLETSFAIKSAVYLHSHAGDKAYAKRGIHSVLPSDIIEEL